MAFLKRRSAEPDSFFPFLTTEEANLVRTMAVECLAKLGVPASDAGDHLESSDYGDFGLHNVAAKCHHTRGKRSIWRTIVAEHFRVGVETILREDPPVRSREDLLAHTIPKLVELASIPPEMRAELSYARPIGDTILELLAFDLPETVVYLQDEGLAQVDIDEIRAAALENLRREPVDERETYDVADGAVIHGMAGSSVFVASRALILEDDLKDCGDHPDGAIFIVPERGQLHFHVVKDATVVPALQALATVAPHAFAQGVAPLSPHVYWWNAGEISQLTELQDDGSLRIIVEEDFLDVLNRVVGE